MPKSYNNRVAALEALETIPLEEDITTIPDWYPNVLMDRMVIGLRT